MMQTVSRDGVIAQARARTGLSDIGEPAIVEGLDILLKSYADVMRDPIGTVRGIYDHFDEPLTPQAEAAMQSYMADSQHGKHSYTLEEFGLTREGIHATFADYIEGYKIPIKR